MNTRRVKRWNEDGISLSLHELDACRCVGSIIEQSLIICRGDENLAGYVKENISSSKYIAIAYSTEKQKIVGFATIYEHDFVSPLSKESICSVDQWYLDIVCAKRIIGLTKTLMNFIYIEARRRGKVSIKIYSVPRAVESWKKLGFLERDNPCDPKTESTLYYPGEPIKRLTKCIIHDHM
jgi:hypothetical protein